MKKSSSTLEPLRTPGAPTGNRRRPRLETPGSATVEANAAAITASTALPPALRTPAPACAVAAAPQLIAALDTVGWRRYVGVGWSRQEVRVLAVLRVVLRAVSRSLDLVATLHHEPGRAMLVDWAGDTLDLVDAVTGQVSKAYLFVAVLPYLRGGVLPGVHVA
ncbi:MAG: hypothetical protein V9G10_12765 [Candidatus Nanopelagicales bacterium]